MNDDDDDDEDAPPPCNDRLRIAPASVGSLYHKSRCVVSIYVNNMIRQHQCDGGTLSCNTFCNIYSRDRPSDICDSISISYFPITRLHVVHLTGNDIFFI